MSNGEDWVFPAPIHEKPRANGNAASILAEIAEGGSDAFSGQEHDSIFYPKKPAA